MIPLSPTAAIVWPLAAIALNPYVVALNATWFQVSPSTLVYINATLTKLDPDGTWPNPTVTNPVYPVVFA